MAYRIRNDRDVGQSRLYVYVDEITDCGREREQLWTWVPMVAALPPSIESAKTLTRQKRWQQRSPIS